jgi:Domain of unknown function (DUF4296)
MHNDIKKVLISCWIFLFAIAACNKQKKILPINEMKVIVWDMLTADEWYNDLQVKDSNAVKNKLNIGLYKNVLQKHKITKEQFYDSYNYYLSKPLQMQVLVDSIEAYGVRKRQLFQAKKK